MLLKLERNGLKFTLEAVTGSFGLSCWRPKITNLVGNSSSLPKELQRLASDSLEAHPRRKVEPESNPNLHNKDKVHWTTSLEGPC
jgi:hypothetical protein